MQFPVLWSSGCPHLEIARLPLEVYKSVDIGKMQQKVCVFIEMDINNMIKWGAVKNINTCKIIFTASLRNPNFYSVSHHSSCTCNIRVLNRRCPVISLPGVGHSWCENGLTEKLTASSSVNKTALLMSREKIVSISSNHFLQPSYAEYHH